MHCRQPIDNSFAQRGALSTRGRRPASRAHVQACLPPFAGALPEASGLRRDEATNRQRIYCQSPWQVVAFALACRRRSITGIISSVARIQATGKWIVGMHCERHPYSMRSEGMPEDESLRGILERVKRQD